MKTANIKDFLTEFELEELKARGILRGTTNLLNRMSVAPLLDLMEEKNVEKLEYPKRKWFIDLERNFKNPKLRHDIQEGKLDDLKVIGMVFDRQNRVLNPHFKKFGSTKKLNNISTHNQKYWMFAPGPEAKYWDYCKNNSCLRFGCDELPDLRNFKSKNEIKSALIKSNPVVKNPMNDTLACWELVQVMKPGDIVIAKKGRKSYLGYGVVTGEYDYDETLPSYRNLRPVKWKKSGEWLEDGKIAMKTLTDITRYSDYVAKLVELIGIDDETIPGGDENSGDYSISDFSEETRISEKVLSRWVRAIERKRQAIFYGPPGTGKTYVAERLARHLVAGGNGFFELVQFHPAYSYEDFIQGIRPLTNEDGALEYSLVPGRFLGFCKKAESSKDICVLIIDEINRANLARVFGELMYLLEYRNQSVPLSSGGSFSIPQNVRIIGTMNTADRSIALVDHALRRRFAFLALNPEYNILAKFHGGTDFPVDSLITILRKLNNQIADPHYEVGITFFLLKDLGTQIEDIWRMEIEPYLEEFFFDQPEKVEEFRWDKIQASIGI